MVKRMACALAAAALIVGVSGGTASAEEQSPWTPYEQPDVTAPAGTACDFEVFSHAVRDHERYRVTETYPDGSHKREEWTGLLVVKFTNTETGKSVVRNLTGRGDFVYGQDGSWSLRLIGGHFAAYLHPGDDPDPGIYVVTGHGYVVSADASGHRVLTEGNGRMENLCETLAS
ncbi:MAG: hypothetical protein ACRDMV_15540 [Streptosporangiales bacterium]